MSLRKEVLQCFKSLHRARQKVFEGDIKTLAKGREKINEEFKKNKNVQDLCTIQELIQTSKNAEHELITTVIQAREVKPGYFKVNIRPETLKLDNLPYKHI